jgi:hypothetical protein
MTRWRRRSPSVWWRCSSAIPARTSAGLEVEVIGFTSPATRVCLISICFGLLLACNRPADQGAPSPDSPESADPAILIEWQGVSSTSNDARGAYAIEAKRVSYRTRRGAAGFIVYHDLADLVISDGKLSIDLLASSGFASIPERIASLLPQPQRASESIRKLGLKYEVDATLAAVTRLVFERPTFILSSPEATFSLEADRGLYDVRSDTLALDDIFVRTAAGDELTAPRAVLTVDGNGLYLPDGFNASERIEQNSVFAVVSRTGALSTTPAEEGRIEYEDLIEKRELLVLRHYVDRAPAAVRPLLMAMLAGLRSASAR